MIGCYSHGCRDGSLETFHFPALPEASRHHQNDGASDQLLTFKLCFDHILQKLEGNNHLISSQSHQVAVPIPGCREYGYGRLRDRFAAIAVAARGPLSCAYRFEIW